MILRCTQRLLKLSGLQASTDPPAPAAVLGEWYANAIGLPFRGRTVLLFAHYPSRLAVIVPGRSVRTTLEPFRQRTGLLLERLGFPRETIEGQLEAMQDVVFTRTADRSMLGSMNDMAFQIRFRADQVSSFDAVDFDAIEDELSEIPHRPLRWRSPTDVVAYLFEQ